MLYEGNELGDRNHLAYIDAIALGCVAAIVSKRKKLSPQTLSALAIIGLDQYYPCFRISEIHLQSRTKLDWAECHLTLYWSGHGTYLDARASPGGKAKKMERFELVIFSRSEQL